jgi:hypothetical protein
MSQRPLSETNLACLQQHPAMAYLFLVRSMRVLRLSVFPAFVALTSCTSTGPAIYSDSARVSAADIQTAITLVQQRCVREKRGLLVVYRVDVDRTDRIFVHCGPHYGMAESRESDHHLVCCEPNRSNQALE